MNQTFKTSEYMAIPMYKRTVPTPFGRAYEIAIDITLKHFGHEHKDLFSHSRKREIVEARYTCFALMRRGYPEASLSTIGQLFQKDHSTVLHGCRVVKNLLKTDKNFEKNFEAIEANFLKTIKK